MKHWQRNVNFMKLLRVLRTANKVSRMFPEGCETGNELDWMLKGNCPVCIVSPLEQTSILEYQRKYPARNTITLGHVTLNLCDRHLEELCNKVEQMRMNG